MKKLNKLVISSEKIMKNEELINLKGGYFPGECGGYGWWTYVCSFRPEPDSPLMGPGIVCAWWELEDGCSAVRRHYPNATSCHCTAQL